MAKVAKSNASGHKAATSSGMMLDPKEVMKAMLAQAQKGKGKEVVSDQGSDEEDGSDSDNDEDDEEHGGEDSDGNSSNAESSTSAQRRVFRKSRSSSEESIESRSKGKSNTEKSATPISTVSSSRSAAPSRVNVAAGKLGSTKTPESPFVAEKPPSTTTFASLGLSQPLINALGSINIKKPTEIQAACVGPIMSGESCWLETQHLESDSRARLYWRSQDG
jgi:ATP-dependent RNA helicase DDX49/DBP8